MKRKSLFWYLSTFLVILTLLMMVIGCTQPTPAGDDDDDDSTGTTTTLAIMPSAVFSAAPDVGTTSATSIIARAFKQAANQTRATGGILNPDDITQLLTPLFTGFKGEPDENVQSYETSIDGIDVTILKLHIGYYMDRKVLLGLVNNPDITESTSSTGSTLQFDLRMIYFQDSNANLTIETTAGDTVVANLYIKYANQSEPAAGGSWVYVQNISNPLNNAENFALTASGSYGTDAFGNSTFTGSGSFTATSEDYSGKGNVSWTENQLGKYISVEDVSITYEGTSTKDYFNVSNMSLSIKVDPDDGTSQVTEKAQITIVDTTGNETVKKKQVTTNNNADGVPEEVAYNVQSTTTDSSGTIIDSEVISGSKVIEVSDTGGIEIGTTDSDATVDTYIDTSDMASGKITVKGILAPSAAEGKKMKVFVLDQADIIMVPDDPTDPYTNYHPEPVTGAELVTSAGNVISNGESTVITDAIDPGLYFLVFSIDMSGDTTFSNFDSFNDDYMAFEFGFEVDGNVSITVGDPAQARGWLKDDGTGKKEYEDTREYVEGKVSFTKVDNTIIPATDLVGKEVSIVVLEVDQYGGEMWDYPIMDGFKPIADGDIVDNTLTMKLFIFDPAFDPSQVSTVVKGFIDMNADYMPSEGDYFLHIEDTSTSIVYDTYSGALTVEVDGWDVMTADMNYQEGGMDFSIYDYNTGSVPNPAAIPSTANVDQYFLDELGMIYDSTNTVGITGTIDASIDIDICDEWFAFLMRPVAGPEEGQNTPPFAIARVDKTTRSFTIDKFAKTITKEGMTEPELVQYMLVVIGYQFFNAEIDEIRAPRDDDWIIMYEREHTWTEYDPQTNTEITHTERHDSPFEFRWDATVNDYVTIEDWSDMGPIWGTTAADAVFSMAMPFAETMKNEGNLNLEGGDLQINVKVTYEAYPHVYAQGDQTVDRPERLLDNPVLIDVIKVETDPNDPSYEFEMFLTGVDRYFSSPDGVDKLDNVFIEFEGAQSTSVYIIKAWQEYYDMATDQYIQYQAEVRIEDPANTQQVELLLAEHTIQFNPDATHDIEISVGVWPWKDAEGITYEQLAAAGYKAYFELMRGPEVVRIVEIPIDSDYNYIRITDVKEDVYEFRVFVDIAEPFVTDFNLTSSTFDAFPEGSDLFPDLMYAYQIDLRGWVPYYPDEPYYVYFDSWIGYNQYNDTGTGGDTTNDPYDPSSDPYIPDTSSDIYYDATTDAYIDNTTGATYVYDDITGAYYDATSGMYYDQYTGAITSDPPSTSSDIYYDVSTDTYIDNATGATYVYDDITGAYYDATNGMYYDPYTGAVTSDPPSTTTSDMYYDETNDIYYDLNNNAYYYDATNDIYYDSVNGIYYDQYTDMTTDTLL